MAANVMIINGLQFVMTMPRKLILIMAEKVPNMKKEILLISIFCWNIHSAQYGRHHIANG